MEIKHRIGLLLFIGGAIGITYNNLQNSICKITPYIQIELCNVYFYPSIASAVAMSIGVILFLLQGEGDAQ